MVEPLRHRQTKGAETDMLDLTPPRHVSTLPIPAGRNASEAAGRGDFGTPATVKGFGRRPFWDGRARYGAGVRKPPKEETAGRKGAVWLGAIYRDLRIAGGELDPIRGTTRGWI